MSRMCGPVFVSLTLILIIWLASASWAQGGPGNQSAANQSLAARVASLEHELDLKGRIIETLLRRTATQMDKINDLQHKLSLMERNVTRFLRYATPSEPRLFRVRRIKKAPDGSYTVILEWKSNPKENRVTQYAIWFAEKGGPYRVGAVVNSTDTRLVKTSLTGFEKGSDIVFKMYAKNAVAHSEATYREAIIKSAAPVLVHKLKILGGLLVLAALVWGGVYALWSRRRP